MKKLCRLAALAGVLACAFWGATPRLAHAQVICEDLDKKPCRTRGMSVTCMWNQPAGAVGVCACDQTTQGLLWDCV